MRNQFTRINDKMNKLAIEWHSHEPIVVVTDKGETTEERIECRSLDELEAWLDEQMNVYQDVIEFEQQYGRIPMRTTNEQIDRIDRKMNWLADGSMGEYQVTWITHDPLSEPISVLYGDGENDEKPMMFDTLDALEKWLDDALDAINVDPLGEDWLEFDRVWSGDWFDDEDNQ